MRLGVGNAMRRPIARAASTREIGFGVETEGAKKVVSASKSRCAVEARRQELAACLFNAESGLLYAPTMYRRSIYKHVPDRVLGQRHQFIENRPTPAQPNSTIGQVDAIDLLNRSAEMAHAD
jgi:hypothetical protein